MSTADPTQSPGTDRRSPRQHRRVDTEAGAPAGEASEAILDLPATPIDPADVGPLTGTLPAALPGVAELPLLKDGRVVSRPGQAPAALARVFESGGTDGFTVASDGVPLGPDGQPLTRRQLRELRRRQESGAAAPVPSAAERPRAEDGQETTPAPSTARRAEAPAGAPAGVVLGEREAEAEPVTRETLASEAAALAERLAAAGDDPEAVDPQLLREQELLAEKARRFNETGALATVPPVAVSVAADATDAVAGAEPVRHDPVEAQSAHGLDSLSASEWGSRERTLMIVAAVVFAVLVIALILALVL